MDDRPIRYDELPLDPDDPPERIMHGEAKALFIREELAGVPEAAALEISMLLAFLPQDDGSRSLSHAFVAPTDDVPSAPMESSPDEP